MSIPVPQPVPTLAVSGGGADGGAARKRRSDRDGGYGEEREQRSQGALRHGASLSGVGHPANRALRGSREGPLRGR